MSAPYTALWVGLQRQLRSAQAGALFDAARGRHPSLAVYPSLAQAVVAPSTRDEPTGDVVLLALTAEYAATRHCVWAAALMVSMQGPLRSLARRMDRTSDGDSTSAVLLVFLEAALAPRATTRRLGLRLYCETRRRLLRAARHQAQCPTHRAHGDVEEIALEPAHRDAETLVDRVRFARSLASRAPRPDESVAAYVARLCARRGEEAPGELAHHRRTQLQALRDALLHVA